MKHPKSDAKALLREVLKQQLAQRPYVSVEVARIALVKAGGRVLALEAEKTLLMDREEIRKFADENQISIAII